MIDKEIENLVNQIGQLNPNDKGKLFSLLFYKEREKKTGKRKELYGSVKLDKEFTDEDIESILYKSKFD